MNNNNCHGGLLTPMVTVEERKGDQRYLGERRCKLFVYEFYI